MGHIEFIHHHHHEQKKIEKTAHETTETLSRKKIIMDERTPVANISRACMKKLFISCFLKFSSEELFGPKSLRKLYGRSIKQDKTEQTGKVDSNRKPVFYISFRKFQM